MLKKKREKKTNTKKSVKKKIHSINTIEKAKMAMQEKNFSALPKLRLQLYLKSEGSKKMLGLYQNSCLL